MDTVKSGVLEWASAWTTQPGETECGDRHVVTAIGDKVMAAAIDGLGHGHDAARAAERAVEVLGQWTGDEDPGALVERCHPELQCTRGAVMSLAQFDPQTRTMVWLGVGNVQGRLLRRTPSGARKHEELLMRSGVVGDRLPVLQKLTLPIARGDVVIFVTDGIGPEFAERIDTTATPDEIADSIIVHHARRDDDALALVAKYRG